VKGQVVETYTLEVNASVVEINILKTEESYVKEYSIELPDFGVGTQALLEKVKKDLILGMGIALEKISDPRFVDQAKKELIQRAEKSMDEELPNIDPKKKSILLSHLINQMMGLGNIEILLEDSNLEEVVVNKASDPVWVYHKKFGWLRTNVFITTEAQIENYSNIIARKVGKQITVLDPLLDAHLVSGDRANATLFPISGHGNTITIRRFRRDPWTVLDLIANKTLTKEIAALLWEGMEYELSVLISGGTASGKTTILGSLLPFIQASHRIISIEDTREIRLPKFMHWVPLTTREPNPEGRGAVEMSDLLVNSLRMRPDRIVVGEIRRKREAEVMFEAMHTGHAVYTTVHANTSDETVRRLTNPPIEVPTSMLSAVNLNVVMFRNRRLGSRRVLELSEFIPERHGSGEESLKVNTLFRWKAGKDIVERQNESIRFYDELGLHTGLTRSEIDVEIADKEKILEWLINQKVAGIENVGKAIAAYYADKKAVVNMAAKNQKFDL
jgi:archaeal flagellar protein FlaI